MVIIVHFYLQRLESSNKVISDSKSSKRKLFVASNSTSVPAGSYSPISTPEEKSPGQCVIKTCIFEYLACLIFL